MKIRREKKKSKQKYIEQILEQEKQETEEKQETADKQETEEKQEETTEKVEETTEKVEETNTEENTVETAESTTETAEKQEETTETVENTVETVEETIEKIEDTENVKLEQVKDEKRLSERKVKNKKLFNRNKDKADLNKHIHDADIVDKSKKDELALYLIIDKQTPGILSYARNFGLNISRIYENIEEAKKMLVLLDKKARVIVMDTGTGKFTTTIIKNELIDAIGTADEDCKFTVFYSDYSLKLDTLDSIGRDNKYVEWAKYQSTPAMIATMMLHSENYVLDDETSEDIEVDDSILMYTGQKCENSLTDNLKLGVITPEDIIENVVNEDVPGIKGYDIDLRY